MSIPNEEFNKVKGGIKKADKILVCSSNKASLDTYSAMAAFVLYLQDINKPVTVAIDGKLPERYSEIFDDVDIEYKNSIEPPSYVVSIDHSGGEIDKVSYDDKDGKFNLYITPSGSGKNFDFENIDFKAGGGNYDLVIVFGVRSLNWIGSLYRKNKSVFDDKAVVNINNLKGAQDYGKVKLVDTEISVGEIVHKLLDGKSTSSSEDIYQLLLLGVIDYLQPMQMNDYKISTVETLTAAVKFGADLKEAFQKLYYKRSFEYFSVVQRLFSNLKVDKKSGLAWAGLSAFDISQTGIAKDDIPLNGRIPFNVCEDFRVAFILYEVHDDEVWVEFEINRADLDAKDILKAFNPSGNSARVVFSVKDKSLLEVENEILSMIKENLDIDNISYKTSEGDSSGNTEHLTSAPNDGNNVSAPNGGSNGAFIAPPPITPSS